jgi:DNA-directed RNA polymerase specialized sigma24 family protein
MILPVDAPAATAADAAALAALLQRLRREGEPGAAYEALRRRLLRFFRLHAPAQAEELADVALDRLARRLDEGVEVAQVASYVLGIARLVALEARAKERRRQSAEDGDWPAEDEESVQERAQDERDAAALSACLEEAGADARGLILDYYGADGAERIRVRQRLAGRLGVSLNALRNRALRLRERLEACLRERLRRDAAP